ncbi:MAG: gamma-glutamylcyclotransferase [Acidobacteriota bacterium]|nr:gamma-glutamylcyclotransferase [Acidobacteriota bacterium]
MISSLIKAALPVSPGYEPCKPHDRIRVIPVSSHPCLFVYGTLKSSFTNRYARRLRREARLLGQAHMPGRLYRIRWYPGMRPPREPADLVTGELYQLRQPVKTLAALDEWEQQYRRELHRATLENGQQSLAWVYMYRQPRPEDCRVVSGEW